MADSLYLSVWFPSFREGEMMSRAVGVLRQFPYSALREGITYLSVHPVAWSEPTVLERRFTPGISPEEAADLGSEFAHDDFAFVFEAFWDLWVPSDDEVDFGLDTAFVYEGLELTSVERDHLRANIAKLIAFSAAVEKNCAISGRVLWSESEDNLGQKLLAKLQQTH